MKINLVVTLLLGFSISVFSQTYDINGDYKISGKVGIGTTSPNVKLNINGAGEIIKISDNVQIVSTDYTLGAFEIQSLDNAIESVNFRISAITEDATGAASMVFGTGRREENAPEKMRIMSNGNVGIGTTNPSEKLHVSGTVKIGDYTTFTPIGTSSLDINVVGNLNLKQGGELLFQLNTDDDVIIGENKDFIIKENGQVGIGTVNPQSKLAVNGTITSTEVVVTTEGWSDFVFNKDYKLKNLEEVESFIEENNHLPDIPSEKEVKENGIQVGEMNAKLLQKIEELTLYMIEQNKETKAMKAQLNKLSEENKELKEKITKLETAE